MRSVTCYADRKKQYSRDLCNALAEGCGGQVVLDQVPRPGIAIISGMADWQRAIMQSPVVEDWYEVDHGYWRRLEYHRIQHRKLWCDGLGEPDYARLDRLGVEIQPARKSGRQVVIALQSPEFYARWTGLDLRHYTAKMVRQVRAATGRPVVLRHKPMGRLRRQPPLGEQLRNTWLLVTHSSAAALDALAAGVPVIVTEKTFCAARLATTFDRIENPYRPSQDERRELFARIAGHQYTLDEMRSGEAWERLSGHRRRTDGARPGEGSGAQGGDPGQGGPPALAPTLGASELHRPTG
jgi:antitoxin (DNA-binding transcriptional repressor) of toxin-antitoxin stability system